MSENYGTPLTPLEEPRKKSNTPLIIAIVVIVVLCCCCAIGGAGYYLYQNGDQLFNLASQHLNQIL